MSSQFLIFNGTKQIFKLAEIVFLPILDIVLMIEGYILLISTIIKFSI